MLSLWIAVRFLTSGRTQAFLIVAGTAVAISVQIFIGLLIGSLQRGLVDQTIGNSPHITISPANDDVTISDWESLVARIRQLDVAKAVSVSASGNAFVNDGGSDLPVILRGFEFEGADRIYDLRSSIYEGRPYDSRREVLVGKDLREELEVNIGDRIAVFSPRGSTSSFAIAGFYDSGTSSINKTWIFAGVRAAQKAFGFGHRITSVEIAVTDVFQADVIAAEIERNLNSPYIKIEDWKGQNQSLLSGLDGQRTSSLIIQAVIIVSVVIAISSVLAMSVLQKSRQIGILKAMGIKDRQASLIFIYQGFLVGLIASVAGIALGMGLLFAFNYFTTNPDGSTLVNLYIDYSFIIGSWLIDLLASTVAGIVPARQSLRLNPIDVIR